MFMGLALGDALGAPCEFGRPSAKSFTGVFTPEWRSVRTSRYGYVVQYEQGQVTDDTEMTIALLQALNDGYTPERAIQQYIDWANSGTKSLGRNTRTLFHGYRRFDTYYRRFDGQKSKNEQGNGFLMRISPVALITDRNARETIAATDTALTNPMPICIEASRLYVALLNQLLYTTETNYGAKTTQLRETVQTALVRTTDVQMIQCLEDALSPEYTRPIREMKGWMMHALSIAIFASLHYDRFDTAITFVIHQGGDTDTNAAIAGAMYCPSCLVIH